MTIVLIVCVLLLFAVIGLGLWIVGLYNELVRMRTAIDQAWANIDVVLKQRHDELPKLVEVCNAYMTHERETLEAVTTARAASLAGRKTEEKTQAENRLTAALGRLFAVAESYPQLLANQTFGQLQQRISAIESQIADRREFFNDAVTVFNTRIQQIPDVFVAQMLQYTPRPLLEIARADAQDVVLSFANRRAA
ncbi:MAG TPA: LemA family protein [Nitrospiria bacterium]|nr:LemA family protein [Nitrospiria bacterium]